MIRETAHVVTMIGPGDMFRSSVSEQIKYMQDKGLEVDIQYQQSDRIYSAFIIGRDKQ